jgi:hypothetical protein
LPSGHELCQFIDVHIVDIKNICASPAHERDPSAGYGEVAYFVPKVIFCTKKVFYAKSVFFKSQYPGTSNAPITRANVTAPKNNVPAIIGALTNNGAVLKLMTMPRIVDIPIRLTASLSREGKSVIGPGNFRAPASPSLTSKDRAIAPLSSVLFAVYLLLANYE